MDKRRVTRAGAGLGIGVEHLQQETSVSLLSRHIKLCPHHIMRSKEYTRPREPATPVT